MRKTSLKRKSKTPLARLKFELWDLCKQITRKVHGNICYTCGKQGLEGGNWQTGHFIAKSTCSRDLAYDIKNLRPQCYHCNINLSGNWIAYEARLIEDMGKEYIEELKTRNRDTKGGQFDIIYYQKKIEEYKEILEQL